MQKVKQCRFCGADISHLHHKAKVCKSYECIQKQVEHRKLIMVNAQLKFQAKRKAQLTNRKCRYCGKFLPEGRMFFCNDDCQSRYAGKERYDGDWLFF